VAVGNVGGRLGRWRRGLQKTQRQPIVRRDRCETNELKLMLFLFGKLHCGTLLPTGHIFEVSQAANDRH